MADIQDSIISEIEILSRNRTFGRWSGLPSLTSTLSDMNATLESLISSHRIRHDDCLFFRGSEVVPPVNYCSSDGEILPQRLAQEFALGGTMQWPHVDRVLPEVRRLCAAFQAILRSPVYANLWVTHAGDYEPFFHFDRQEVVIMQLAGRKHWRVHEFSEKIFTTRSGAAIEGHDPGPIVFEGDVGPGDILFVPGGAPHCVTPLDDYVCHLSILFTPALWRDLAETVMTALEAEGSALYEQVPAATLWSQDVTAIRAGLLEAMGRAITPACMQTAIESNLSQQLVKMTAPVAVPKFVPAEEVRQISQTALLRRRADVSGIVIEKGDEAEIRYFGGGGLAMPAPAADLLRFVISAERPFTLDSLPGPLDAASQVLVVDRLIDQGLVELA